MILEHQHYNRIRQIIEHPDNNAKHLQPITNILETYRNMFGVSKLYLKLLKKQTNLYKTI